MILGVVAALKVAGPSLARRSQCGARHGGGRDLEPGCPVGRLRKDCALDSGVCFAVAGDQLLKGATPHALQIAKELMMRPPAE